METVIHSFVNKLQHCEFAQTTLMATRRHLLCGMNTHMAYVSPGLPFAESQLANTPVASLSDAQVRRQLLASTKKTEHLTEVLRESEANSMRLADQAKLLKEEIRRCVLSCMQCACSCTCWWCCVLTWLCLLLCLFRLERNKDREESVSNMEYLKNVILKVCTYRIVCTCTSVWCARKHQMVEDLPMIGRCYVPWFTVVCSLLQFLHTTGQEQAQLVPVITSLLKLSQQERVFLEEVLKGVY